MPEYAVIDKNEFLYNKTHILHYNYRFAIWISKNLEVLIWNTPSIGKEENSMKIP